MLHGARSLSLLPLAAVREMTWPCLSVPCVAPGREVRGRAYVVYRKQQNMWRILVVVPVLAALLLISSLLIKS